MRGIFKTVKAFLATAFVIGCVLFVYALAASPVFGGGERYEFYTGTSSSEIVLSRSPLKKIFLHGVKGESVRYTGDRVQELIDEFGAEILFTEEAAGIVNYYCYAPALNEWVELNGQRVNLHVASDGAATAAGTPVIFGGF